MKPAGQADAEHPILVDGAPGCGQDAGHAAGHQAAPQSEMVPSVGGSPV